MYKVPVYDFVKDKLCLQKIYVMVLNKTILRLKIFVKNLLNYIILAVVETMVRIMRGE